MRDEEDIHMKTVLIAVLFLLFFLVGYLVAKRIDFSMSRFRKEKRKYDHGPK